MRKQIMVKSIFMFLCFLLVTWLPCQAAPPNKPPKYQLACVTANIGQDADNNFELTAEISYQKNISMSVPSEVFEICKGDVNQKGCYKFGAYCKNEWIMVSCTQNSGEPSYEIDIKQDIGCARDREVFHDPAKIYVTCCKIM
jgi:hypothetical protein